MGYLKLNEKENKCEIELSIIDDNEELGNLLIKEINILDKTYYNLHYII